MFRIPLRQSMTVLPLLVLFLTFRFALTAEAQTVAKTPPKKPRVTKAMAHKNANIKSGTIVAIDAAALKVTLKTTTGETLPYTLADATRYFKNKKESEAAAFKAGDAVTLKLRKVRGLAAFYVFEMADTASYDWLTDLRKTTKTAVIKEIGGDTLTVTIDGVDAEYTVSDKTRWNRGGKEVSDSAFKAGDKVAVIPRSLPSGNVMARVVADNVKDAELSKAEGAGILSGVFQSVSGTAHTVTFVMDGDAPRTVLYNTDTEVRLRTKTTKLSSLKAGQHIVVHIAHQDDGKDLATRITIEQTRAKRAPKAGI